MKTKALLLLMCLVFLACGGGGGGGTSVTHLFQGQYIGGWASGSDPNGNPWASGNAEMQVDGQGNVTGTIFDFHELPPDEFGDGTFSGTIDNTGHLVGTISYASSPNGSLEAHLVRSGDTVTGDFHQFISGNEWITQVEFER